MATSVSVSLAAEEWTEVNSKLIGATPHEILEWAVERFQNRLTMATAFGAEGCVLIHSWRRLTAKCGFSISTRAISSPETLELRDRICERYGIEVELVRPETTMAEYENQHGGPLYVSHPDQCCYDRKIVPLRRALVGYDAWITAIRADQSSTRGAASVVGVDRKFGLVKVNPLLTWTRRDVWAYHRHASRCRTTRCTTRDMRRSGAGRARERWPRAG